MEEDSSPYKVEIEKLRQENAKLKADKETIGAYLNNLVQVIPASIYWKNIDSVILGGNLSHAKLAGYNDPKEVVGKTDYDFIWKDDAKHIIENDKKIMCSKKGLQLEESGLLIDHRKHTFLTFKEPMFDKNKNVIGIIGVSLDITELKETQEKLEKAKETAESALISLQESQIEEQKQRKEAERLDIENIQQKAALEIAQATSKKEQDMRKMVMTLVGDIVHDLATPMATIEMGANALEAVSPGLNEVIKEARELKSAKLDSINSKKLDFVLNKVASDQKKYLNFMREFIDVTLAELTLAHKYQDGAIARGELNKCSIRRVLENVIEAYQRSRNLIINQCFSYDFIFLGNSILMMKILFNLIKNAEEQIIANGKGEITITTQAAPENNLVSIKDTAGGAAPEVVDNFFKGFFTTKPGGTGIGLAFCKKIMQNFGGDLTCHSVFGESMEFILSFPKIADTIPYNSISSIV